MTGSTWCSRVVPGDAGPVQSGDLVVHPGERPPGRRLDQGPCLPVQPVAVVLLRRPGQLGDRPARQTGQRGDHLVGVGRPGRGPGRGAGQGQQPGAVSAADLGGHGRTWADMGGAYGGEGGGAGEFPW
ncbi:hypothetical protein B591_25228 [Streptomyces sp. GBA 94-10 4N24]|nr:hypothetical protein B591_25228 [Streptomyces sp. GBA 94-10 4N24]UZN62061.1 hypothetical protein B591N_25228 [Streptomyces sp. GBA 94-10 4N24]